MIALVGSKAVPLLRLEGVEKKHRHLTARAVLTAEGARPMEEEGVAPPGLVSGIELGTLRLSAR